jgi:hypothetical protein
VSVDDDDACVACAECGVELLRGEKLLMLPTNHGIIVVCMTCAERLFDKVMAEDFPTSQ